MFLLTTLYEKSPTGWCLNSIHYKLEPITLFAEDTMYYTLFDILKSFLPTGISHESSNFSSNITNNSNEDSSQDKFPITIKLKKDILLKSYEMANPIYIKELIIEPISILLSVHASVKLYISLDQSPLHFNKYIRHRLMTTSYNLGHNMAMHFLSGALFRAGWVVGSLDILGNPGGFARTVGTGVKDFVQFPYEGILQGPWAFVTGITHGSLSLVKHLTAGNF